MSTFKSQNLQKPSMSRPAKLAFGLLGLAILSFVGLTYSITVWPELEYLWVLLILRHGCEGALVGCICDIIAVRNVYSKAKDNFEPLVENVSRAVVIDMIQVRHLIKQMAQLNALQREENQAWFQERLQDLVPSRIVIEEKLNTFWAESLWRETANWLAAIDFHPILTGSSGKSMRLLEVPELRNTLATLMEVATEDRDLTVEMLERVRALGQSFTLSDLGVPAEEAELEILLEAIWEHWQSHQIESRSNLRDSATDWIFHKVISRMSVSLAPVVARTTVVDILNPMLNEVRVTEAMHELAKRIREEAEEVEGDNPLLYDSIVMYMGALADAWSMLPEEHRQQTMLALLDAWKPVVLSLLSDVLWWLRLQLMRPDEILALPRFQQMLTHLSDQSLERGEEIEEKAVVLLQTQLRHLGKDGFVMMLQRNTQAQLDWIKVNGTIFGFLLGTFVGGVAVLIEQVFH